MDRKVLKSLGDIGQALARNAKSTPAAPDPVLKGLRWGPVREESEKAVGAWGSRDKTAMSEGSGAQGGFLVPEEIQLQIDEGMYEDTVFAKLARQQRMKSRDCLIPGFDIAASHNTGESPLLGGMAAVWVAEGASTPESEPKFSGAGLVARNLMCLVLASNQLVQDGGEALGSYLMYQFSQCLSFYVERACYLGKGAPEPQGVVSSPATRQVARTTSSTISLPDVGNMVKNLLPGCFKRAFWAASPTAISNIVQIPTYNSQINGPAEGTTALCGMLEGRPLYATENLPPLGTAGDLMLIDPKMYALGTRSVEIAVSTQSQSAFYNNQTAYRLWWRGDGQPIPRGTSTLADGSTSSGAFVALV